MLEYQALCTHHSCLEEMRAEECQGLLQLVSAISQPVSVQGSDSVFLFCFSPQSAIESLFGASMTGIAYSLFAGQPLTILGSTGPVLVFEKILFKFCK